MSLSFTFCFVNRSSEFLYKTVNKMQSVVSTLTSTVYRLYCDYVVPTKDYKLNQFKDTNKHKFAFSPNGRYSSHKWCGWNDAFQFTYCASLTLSASFVKNKNVQLRQEVCLTLHCKKQSTLRFSPTIYCEADDKKICISLHILCGALQSAVLVEYRQSWQTDLPNMRSGCARCWCLCMIMLTAAWEVELPERENRKKKTLAEQNKKKFPFWCEGTTIITFGKILC